MARRSSKKKNGHRHRLDNAYADKTIRDMSKSADELIKGLSRKAQEKARQEKESMD
jgi:hypothetical protein